MSIHRAVAEARQRLHAAGLPDSDASLDARVIAEHVLRWDTARLLAHGHETLPAAMLAKYEALVARRVSGEPLAYLTGHREFWNLSFEVSPAVLIPRPETELLVAAAVERLAPTSAPHVADVCTGSGCIAVALATSRRHAVIVGTDVSPAALAIARRNARTHGVDDRVHFVASDLLSAVAGPLDLIVANPPYVAETDYASLQREVRDYEPPAALLAGPDGLQAIRMLLPQGAERLAVGGALIFEFGYGQANAVARLISNTPGLRMVEIRRDLQDVPRAAVVERA